MRSTSGAIAVAVIIVGGLLTKYALLPYVHQLDKSVAKNPSHGSLDARKGSGPQPSLPCQGGSPKTGTIWAGNARWSDKYSSYDMPVRITFDSVVGDQFKGLLFFNVSNQSQVTGHLAHDCPVFDSATPMVSGGNSSGDGNIVQGLPSVTGCAMAWTGAGLFSSNTFRCTAGKLQLDLDP